MIKKIHMSILLKTTALITVLCLLIMSYSTYVLYSSWTSYQQVIELRNFQDMTQNFTDGLKNFMFERGRMNVVLTKEQSISDENSVFINERRMAADAAFEAGFSCMEKAFPKETEKLQKYYENINKLRIKIDLEAVKPLSQRDENSQKLWFNSCTDYINAVINEINVIRALSQNNYVISNSFDLIVDSLSFRSIIGNEASIIASAIAGNGIISDEQNSSLLFLMGEEAQIWSELEKTSLLLNSESLTESFENVQEQFYLKFRPEQQRIMELARNNQLYEGADIEIANLSVPALNSVMLISDEALKVIEIEKQESIVKEFKSVLIALSQLLISIFIVIFVPIYFRKRFSKPINEIINTLENISNGKAGYQIPYLKRADEIGKLAHGANMLQNSIIEQQTLKYDLEQTVLKLEELSTKDSLTALYNRRYMDERFEELAKRYKRTGTTFSVIMCDIDYFKSFNDQYGHECGDTVLVHIAANISDYCRETDIIARWGGEEFLILLPDTNREAAKSLAERLREGLASTTFEYNFLKLQVTLTFGVVEYSEKEGIQGTVRKADMALLQGKNNGRNQVVVH